MDDLFASLPWQLVDDAQGGIRYWPDFIDEALAWQWFRDLHAKAAWTRLQRPMYERVVDVPRLLSNHDVDALPPELPLADMLVRVRARVPAPYSRIGMNLYRDGNDSVALHSDKLHLLREGHPITLVSLGAPRRMLIKAKTAGRRAIAIELMPGSLLSMSYASQLTHAHGIPKTRRLQEPRISVVFRVRP